MSLKGLLSKGCLSDKSERNGDCLEKTETREDQEVSKKREEGEEGIRR